MNLDINGSQLERPGPGAAAPVSDGANPDVFPLSLMQESLWLLEQMAPGSPAYNLVEAWRLRGDLDVPAMRTSLQEIARRHETLRTLIVLCDGRPAQQLLPRAELELPLVDLTEAAEPQEQLRIQLQAEARRPFQFDAGPLARLRLFKLAPQEHVLFLNLHHIISDGWSLQVLLRELGEQYSAAREGRPARVPDLPIQYPDFAVWQRQMASAGSFRGQVEYWKQKLSAPLPGPALPSDRQRPEMPTFRGQTHFFMLAKSTVDGLKELSRREGTTLFMTLLAAFKVLLTRLTGQTDIVVGSPMAGRVRVETENLVGFFVNTHALRTELSGEPTFLEVLRRVRETVLGAAANQEVPLEQVLEALNPGRALNRHPLFQVVFGLLSGFPARFQFAGLSAERMDLDNGGAKFDWTLLFTETEEGLLARSEYSTDLFEASTLERWGRHYQTLLGEVLAHPALPISRLHIVDDTERAALFAQWNPAPTESVPERCVHRWFEEQVRKTPEATAVVCEGQRLTYREVNRQANQLARHLQKCGVGLETPVALCLERSTQLVVALLGVLKAGGLYVPMDPGCPKERLRFMMEDTVASVLITQASLREKLPDTAARLVCLDTEWDSIGRESAEELDTAVRPENGAYVIYTSGSTGTPKGVVVTHYNVVRLFEQTERWFGFNSRDVWCLFHSYTFDFSVWEMWGALLYGGRLVIVPYLVSRAPDEFYQLLASERVTVLNQTPSAFRQLIWAEANSSQTPDLCLRYVIFGGEALELQSLRPWLERHGDEQPRLVNMYGITETTVHVTYRVIRKADVDRGLGSVIGTPIPDLRLYLLDAALQPVPIGVAGELCVGGAGVARGYLKRPELTNQRFVSHPFSSKPGAHLYRSGDLARYSSAGELEYLGRMDDQVKIRGFRVELGEIESALNRHPAVRESAVVAQPDGSGAHRLVAYIVASQEQPAYDTLQLHLRKSLPEHMVPEVYVPLDKLPLTHNGKIDRRALPSAEAAPKAQVPTNDPPQTLMEKQVAAIWCEVLGKAQVGREENFFSSGGHSLSATQVMARLGAGLNLELSVRLLFEAPTVAGLAGAIEKAQRESTGQAAKIARRAETSVADEWLGRLEKLTSEELDELLRQTEDKTLSA